MDRRGKPNTAASPGNMDVPVRISGAGDVVPPGAGASATHGLSVTWDLSVTGKDMVRAANAAERTGRSVDRSRAPPRSGPPCSRWRLARMWQVAEMVASQGFRTSSARIFSRVCSRVSAPTWRSRIEPRGSTNAVNGSAADRLP